jgi:hypothetical protein
MRKLLILLALSVGIATAQCTNGTTPVFDWSVGRLTTSCKPGSGSTFKQSFYGNCNGSTTLWATVDLPPGGVSMIPAGCDGGAGYKAVLRAPNNTSTRYIIISGLVLPATYVSGTAISFQADFRSADSTNATVLTKSYACVAAGTLDAPSFTSAGTVSLTAAASSNRTIATTTVSPTCAAGNELRIKLLADTTALTGGATFDLAGVVF